MKCYVVHGRIVLPIALKDWRLQSIEERRVAEDTLGDVYVSTVFLGLDHGWGDGPPQLFETMIFGGEYDQYQERYSSWDQAEAGHAAAVALVKGEEAP